MHLSGSNRSNCQAQAALNAVTNITKESVCFIIIYCFFTVGTVKFLQLSFVIFVEEEFAEFGFVREECEKNFENHCVSQCVDRPVKTSCGFVNMTKKAENAQWKNVFFSLNYKSFPI